MTEVGQKKLTSKQVYTAKLENDMILANVKFQKACEQWKLLNNYYTSCEQRFMRSRNLPHRISSYNQRISLCVLDGVRFMYHEYVSVKARELDELKQRWMELQHSEFDEEEDSAFCDSEDGGLSDIGGE